jgi:hypothetical protein
LPSSGLINTQGDNLQRNKTKRYPDVWRATFSNQQWLEIKEEEATAVVVATEVGEVVEATAAVAEVEVVVEATLEDLTDMATVREMVPDPSSLIGLLAKLNFIISYS